MNRKNLNRLQEIYGPGKYEISWWVKQDQLHSVVKRYFNNKWRLVTVATAKTNKNGEATSFLYVIFKKGV